MGISNDQIEIIWHGTASVEIKGPEGRLLFDPFVTLPGAENMVPVSEFDGFTDILVTHGHFDHIASIPEIVRRNPDVTVHCTGTPYHTLLRKGVPEANLNMTAIGGTEQIRGFTVHLLQGKHAVLQATRERIRKILKSGHLANLPYIIKEALLCRENGETVFYQIECPVDRPSLADLDGQLDTTDRGAVGTVSHAGGQNAAAARETANARGAAAPRETISLMGSLNLAGNVKYPSGSDLLILPYNGWVDNLQPAVRVMKRLKPKRVLIDHYDTSFPPLTTPLDLSPFLERYPEAAPMVFGRPERL